MANGNYLYCIYADDVRYENNGKIIYIGVYSGSILLNSGYPYTAPQIFVAPVIFYDKPADIESIKISISYSGQDSFDLIEQDIPDDFIKKVRSSDYADGPMHIQMMFSISPITFPFAGEVRTVVTINGDEVLEGNSLKVELAGGAEPQALPD